ncbi:MAG: molybdenum cofactor biosynthesis protein B [Pirellulales bacterium]
MSQSAADHRRDSPATIRCAVVTVSDTRTLETDTGGQTIVDLLAGGGHEVTVREIVPDEPRQLRTLLVQLANRPDIDAVLVTGGTGISQRDRTFETVAELLDKQIPGYGELFRWLSFQEIGAAAMLSRTIGGLLGHTVVLTMPGSPHAVRLAVERLILPELAHLVREARR